MNDKVRRLLSRDSGIQNTAENLKRELLKGKDRFPFKRFVLTAKGRGNSEADDMSAERQRGNHWVFPWGVNVKIY